MGVLNPTVGRMTPKTDIQQFVYTSLSSAYVADPAASLQFWNMWNGFLGSTNGTTYGTQSQIGIQMAREYWASLFVGVYIEVAFNRDIVMNVYQMYNIAAVPFYSRDQRTQLLSVTIPQTAFFRFALSDALPADGGLLGSSIAVNQGHYRVAPGLACPCIGIEFTAATAPTVGRFFSVEIGRAS